MWEQFVVIDGKEYKVFMEKPYETEKEVEDACRYWRDVINFHFGLENGDFIAANQESCNFHFIAKKVV